MDVSRDFFSSVTPVPVCTGINSGGGLFFIFILIIPLLSVARGGTAHPFANPAALQAAESLGSPPEGLLPNLVPN
jgi:hypothetical protein